MKSSLYVMGAYRLLKKAQVCFLERITNVLNKIHGVFAEFMEECTLDVEALGESEQSGTGE